MERNETKNSVVNEPEKKQDWGTGSCPFIFFGDDDAAEYDVKKIKKFFSKFKKKSKHGNEDL